MAGAQTTLYVLFSLTGLSLLVGLVPLRRSLHFKLSLQRGSLWFE